MTRVIKRSELLIHAKITITDTTSFHLTSLTLFINNKLTFCIFRVHFKCWIVHTICLLSFLLIFFNFIELLYTSTAKYQEKNRGCNVNGRSNVEYQVPLCHSILKSKITL